MRLIFTNFVKIVLYAVFVTISALIVRFDAGSAAIDGSKFSEGSLTEIFQLIFIFTSSVIFYVTGILNSKSKSIGFLMGGGAMAAFIREMDAYFDLIYHGAWFPFALAVLAYSVYISYKSRNGFYSAVESYSKTTSFGLFISGFMSLFIFSRLFGKKTVWMALFDLERLEGPYRWVKNAAEEGSELFGYTLVLLCAFEFYLFFKSYRNDMK
ncbi:MAG: hypothetical protein N4A49_05665 [Marinifilaceae bacterium]|jgi:hypothetical protein|nr:hypothetical protein [Marinifilaceae bacterium]